MKILVADDSATMRAIIIRALSDMGYDDVVQVDCGEDALSSLEAFPDIDMVLLDWNMPLMNGFDCLKAIRANPETCKLPVIMVTTESMRENVLVALQHGATNYIAKPFTPEKLRAVIEKSLGS